MPVVLVTLDEPEEEEPANCQGCTDAKVNLCKFFIFKCSSYEIGREAEGDDHEAANGRASQVGLHVADGKLSDDGQKACFPEGREERSQKNEYQGGDVEGSLRKSCERTNYSQGQEGSTVSSNRYEDLILGIILSKVKIDVWNADLRTFRNMNMPLSKKVYLTTMKMMVKCDKKSRAIASPSSFILKKLCPAKRTFQGKWELKP